MSADNEVIYKFTCKVDGKREAIARETQTRPTHASQLPWSQLIYPVIPPEKTLSEIVWVFVPLVCSLAFVFTQKYYLLIKLKMFVTRRDKSATHTDTKQDSFRLWLLSPTTTLFVTLVLLSRKFLFFIFASFAQQLTVTRICTPEGKFTAREFSLIHPNFIHIAI